MREESRVGQLRSRFPPIHVLPTENSSNSDQDLSFVASPFDLSPSGLDSFPGTFAAFLSRHPRCTDGTAYFATLCPLFLKVVENLWW